MLVLTRRIGESIRVPSCGITVKILEVRGSKVRLGINAPQEIKVLRDELSEYPREPVLAEVESAGNS
jgi:carbon storage regulator